MKVLNYVKKKIVLRKQRKAIMSKISFTNGKIVIDADLLVRGTITGK